MQLDGRALPYSEEFDVACAFDVLEHIDDDQATLAGLHHALKPDGILLITVPQHPRLWSAADEYAHHQRRYTRRLLRKRLREAGFEIVRMTSFVTTLLPLMALSRAMTRTLDDSYEPERELRNGRATNWVLERAVNVDHLMIKAGISLPAGGSLLAIARRPLQ